MIKEVMFANVKVGERFRAAVEDKSRWVKLGKHVAGRLEFRSPRRRNFKRDIGVAVERGSR